MLLKHVILEQVMDDILDKYGLSLIILHGSQVGEMTHAQSDTDIAILKKDRSKKFSYLSFLHDLSNKLNTDRVDITDLGTANPLLLYAVMRKSKLLAGCKSDYEKMMYLAFHKYSDYLPYLKKEAEFVKERIETYA